MATNVSEKDKTLNEIIDWVKSRCHEAGLSRFDVRRKSDRDFYDGQVNAFHEMLELCRSMRLQRLHAFRGAESKRGCEMSRTETTAMLSELVEERLRNQAAFWASEVNFDRGTPDERRVDYVGFKPWNINGQPVRASVEKGCFGFYEVKSCMADFTSGNGLTFYGDQNYLVCTKELCDEIVWQKMVPPQVNAILTPDSTGSKLILGHVQSNHDLSYRRRPASEILWAMVKANGKRTN